MEYCMVCERFGWIKNGKNPYFVKELNTGYVVIGDHQRIKGYSLFLCKEHATELHFLEPDFRDKFLPMPEELDDLKKRLRIELDKLLEK